MQTMLATVLITASISRALVVSTTVVLVINQRLSLAVSILSLQFSHLIRSY
jgi:hypothetical protein